MDEFSERNLDAEALLALAESTLLRRRQLDLDDLRTCAHWAMLHQHTPDRRVKGGPKLVVLGGEGTPPVQDLCLAELALCRRTHVLATRAVVAEVLDLVHRLPRCWQVVEALDCETWVARKIARLTRHLTAPEAAHVDAAVADALAGEQPSRVFTLVEAKIIEANPTTHEQRIAAERARRYVTLGRVDETGLRHVIARVEHGDAIWVDALINRIADILATRDTTTGDPTHDLDHRRAEAFGWLARPAELLTLLLEHAHDPDNPGSNEPAEPDTEQDSPDQPHGPGAPPGPHTPEEPDSHSEPDGDGEPENRGEPGGDTEPGADWVRGFPTRMLDTLRSIDPTKLRPQAVVHLHLHQAALTGHSTSTSRGVARLEDGGGPRLLDHVKDVIGAAHVTIKPVIDLNEHVSVHAYEFPQWLRERIHLINPVEPFPHSTRAERRHGTDMDHVTPYQPTRASPPPPGQTGTHNAAPLGRFAHRVKTHAGYTVRQLKPGTYVWRTPHHRYRLVDHTGTHLLHPSLGRALTGPDELARAIAEIWIHTNPHDIGDNTAYPGLPPDPEHLLELEEQLLGA